MKKIFLFIILITEICNVQGQIAISALPSHNGSISGALVPIVVNGITKKYDLGNLQALISSKTDTAKSRRDSLTLATAINTKPTYGDVRYIVSDSLLGFVRLQSQNPTAIINPTLNYERRPSGTFVQQFDWTVGREAANTSNRATDSILTVSVDGTNRSFTQPAAGASYSGSTNITITYNTNKRVNLLVTTKDGKTAYTYADVNMYDKRYIGWSTTTNPTDAEIRAAVEQDNNGGTASYTANLSQLGAPRFLFYANKVSISNVTINGFNSTADFSLNTSRTFTNASGGISTYLVSTSNAAFGNLGSTNASFQ